MHIINYVFFFKGLGSDISKDLIIKNLKEKIDLARENQEVLEAKLFKTDEQNLVYFYLIFCCQNNYIKKTQLFLFGGYM